MEGANAFSIAYENLPTKTYSAPDAFPSALKSRRALVQNTMDEGEQAKARDPVVCSSSPLFYLLHIGF